MILPMAAVLLAPAPAAAYVECGLRVRATRASKVIRFQYHSGGSPGRSCDPNYAGACDI